jgi:hypothetical protein
MDLINEQTLGIAPADAVCAELPEIQGGLLAA